MPLITPYWVRRVLGSSGSAPGSTVFLYHFNTDKTDATGVYAAFEDNVSATIGTTTPNPQFGAGYLEILDDGNPSLANYTSPTITITDTDWTWEYWFQFDLEDDLGYCNIQGDGGGAGELGTLGIVWTSDANTVDVEISGGVSGAQPSFVGTIALGSTIVADSWYHTAIVQESNSCSFYFNGNRISTDAAFSAGRTLGILTQSQVSLQSNNANFYIDDYRFSRVARYSGATYTIPIAEFTVD